MEFNKVYTIEKETTQQEFLRKLLIELASSLDTPIDIVKAKFGKIEEKVCEAIVCTSYVDLNYTASIGYDYKIKVYENGKEKEKTITKWKPFSGHLSGTKTECTFNAPYEQHFNSYTLRDTLNSVKNESIIQKGNARLTSYGLESAKWECERALRSEIEYPGNHHKDESITSDVSVKSIRCYILPYYQVEYTYRGKKYSVTGFACGNPNFMLELPPNDIDIKQQTKRKTQGSKNAMLIGWSLFTAAIIYAFISCKAGSYWQCFLSIPTLIMAIILHSTYDKKFNHALSSFTKILLNSKKELLEKMLIAKSYQRLSEKESSSFDSKASLNNQEYLASNKKKGAKGMAIFCSIISIILIAVCTVKSKQAADAALHTPEQITIEIIDKEQEYKPYESVYINGCYYIYFDYKISANEIGVSNMKVITYVYNKSTGEELGSIETSFNYMNLNAGTSKTFSVELSDNQPEKNNNTFFIEVYNASFQELEFKYEFDYICFDDHEYYYSKN